MADCSLCLSKLGDDTPTLALKCAHTFHKECFERMCEVEGIDRTTDELYDVACPVCKQTGKEISEQEGARLQDTDACKASPPSSPAPSENTVEDLIMPQTVRAASEGFQIESQPVWNGKARDSKIVCVDCNQVCEKFRITSKASAEFRCAKCGYTHTRLYRHEGAGYRQSLARLPDDVRAKFFASSHGENAKQQRNSFATAMEQYSVREKVFEHGGAFKPLKVWETLGYDPRAIAERSDPEDVLPSRMFGLVYRVPELTVFVRGADGKKDSSSASATHGVKRPRVKAEGAAEEGSKSDSDVSSSSSSSTSNDQKRKKKQKKKQKKKAKRDEREAEKLKETIKENARKEKEAAKEKLRAEKAAERQALLQQKRDEADAKRAAAKAKASAESVVKKVEKCLDSILKALRSSGSSKVPQETSEPLQQIAESFSTIIRGANDFAKGNEEDWEPPPDLKVMLEKAKRHEALFLLAARTYK